MTKRHSGKHSKPAASLARPASRRRKLSSGRPAASRGAQAACAALEMAEAGSENLPAQTAPLPGKRARRRQQARADREKQQDGTRNAPRREAASVAATPPLRATLGTPEALALLQQALTPPEPAKARRQRAGTAKARKAGIATAPIATASFPPGLVAPRGLGVAIHSVPLPAITSAPRSTPPSQPTATKAPAAASSPASLTAPLPGPLADPLAGPEDKRPALPLPTTAEPLVITGPIPGPATPLPRNKAVARPTQGLVAAIGAWLYSMGRLIAAGFLVKKTRKRPVPTRIAPLPTRAAEEQPLRERTELAQLRAENRRLRGQIEAMDALRTSAPRRELIKP